MASFKFRVVLCRIRLFPTLSSKIKWLGSELPLKWGASSRWLLSLHPHAKIGPNDHRNGASHFIKRIDENKVHFRLNLFRVESFDFSSVFYLNVQVFYVFCSFTQDLNCIQNSGNTSTGGVTILVIHVVFK